MKIVFIASLVHSGSTVLDLALGGHPRLTGLGELSGLLDPYRENLDRRSEIICSCGAALEGCPFWGPAMRQIDFDPSASISSRYSELAVTFRKQFGPQHVLVDSSKSLDSLQTWTQLAQTELRVIHLIRDVRAWSVSMTELHRRRRQYHMRHLLQQQGWRAPRAWLAQTTLNRFRQWYMGNRRIEAFLHKTRLASLRIGYEEFCLQPDRTLDAISRFLEIEPFQASGTLERSSSHVVLGNRMQHQKQKRRGIYYDNRWMQRRDWMLPALLLRGVMRYNTENVYRNLGDRLWDS